MGCSIDSGYGIDYGLLSFIDSIFQFRLIGLLKILRREFVSAVWTYPHGRVKRALALRASLDYWFSSLIELLAVSDPEFIEVRPEFGVVAYEVQHEAVRFPRSDTLAPAENLLIEGCRLRRSRHEYAVDVDYIHTRSEFSHGTEDLPFTLDEGLHIGVGGKVVKLAMNCAGGNTGIVEGVSKLLGMLDSHTE